MGLTTIVLLAPVAFAGAFACARWPTVAVLLVFLLTGFQLTVAAHLSLPPAGVIDLLLLGLWLGVLWSYIRGSNERPLWLWTGLAAPAVYLAITFASVFATDSTSDAFESFRLAGWPMAALFLVALAPWPAGTHMKIARGIAAITVAVGLYAVYRKLTGPTASELQLHRAALGRQLPPEGLFGSFYRAQALAAWCGMMVPFTLALALAWRGRWQLVAALGGILSTFALFASDRRAAVIGGVAGSLLVVVLMLMAARPFGARRLGAAFLAVTVSVAVGIGVYTVTVARSPATVDRFESLLTPSEDLNYRLRLVRWEAALETAAERPFGHGLGTVGVVGEGRTDKSPIAPFLDSSYLKIAVEQGFPMLAVFAIAMLWLTASLASRAITAASPERAMLAIGACGTMITMLVLFYTSFFIESLTLVAGWLIVGLAAAQFTGASDPVPRTSVPRRQPAPAPLPSPSPPVPGTPKPERPLARTG